MRTPGLEYLYLQVNKLQHVDSDVFSGLVNLKAIYLEGNEILYLHPHRFLGLPIFQELYLGFNSGLQVPIDSNLIKSHSLSLLRLSGCNISSLSVETFANVGALKWLDLSDNNLKTADINILRALPKLSTLYLYGNPLQRDCQLQEVWRWCEDRNIQTGFEQQPECNTPNEVEGMWWGVLENGQYLDGNIQYYGDYRNTTYRNRVIGEQDYYYDYDVDFLNRYQIQVYAVPFIFGTTGNVILLIITICNKDMRTVPNMYILNLAVSDIIYLTIIFSEAWANRKSDTSLG